MLAPLPLRGRICDAVPWVVIEVVSPDDTVGKTRARFLDYTRLGLPHVLQMDPEEYVLHRFDKGSMIQTRLETLEMPTGSVPFDSEQIFQQLRTELAELERE